MNNEIKKKNLKQTAVNGFSWMLVGTVGQNLLQFATLIILARLITPSEFGVVTIAMLIIGFLKIFSELGVGPAIVQKKELSNEHIKTANTLALLLGILLSICLYFSASIIASFFNMEKLEYVIVVLSFMVVLLLSFSLRGKVSSVRFRDFLDSSFLRLRDILDSIPY